MNITDEPEMMRIDNEFVGGLISAYHKRILRLQRKIDKRDAKIAGLNRKVEQLETELSVHVMMIKRLPIDITRAVQEALCNVRMIPVMGLRSNDKIVEIRNAGT